MAVRTKRLIAATAAVAVLAAACSSAPQTRSKFDAGDLDLIASLERFEGCEDLLDHLESEALERVGPYGFDGVVQAFPLFEEELAPDEALSDIDGAAASEPALGGDGVGREAGVDYSTTNVQEAGVDEPDIAKTDGERILAVANNRLHYVDVARGEPRLLGSVRLPDGWGHEILVSGDRVLVLASTDSVLRAESESLGSDLVAPVAGAVLVEIDVSDPDDMEIRSTLTVDGSYMTARQVGDTTRVVVSSPPPMFDFVYPSSSSRRAEQIAEEANRRVIVDSTIEDWLPSYALEAGDPLEAGNGVSSGVLVDCDRLHRPGDFSGFSVVTVLTIDMTAPLGTGDGVAVLADGETVYASEQNLYVATNRWVDRVGLDGGTVEPSLLDDTYVTALHKFDISGTGPASYSASGSVRGHLLNQFSMSEQDRYLRVATTDGAPWGVTDRSESYVTVLAEQDGRLATVGQVGDLGRGEQIFSVRFVGEVGYVVTFRQTDPLYTVDLSNPANPVTRGELEILGYSAYLHPVDESTLIGVGQDATETGQTLGTQVSLFDVSDLANPTRTDRFTLAGGTSDVEFDHRAFLYWAPTRLAVLPLQSYGFDIGIPDDTGIVEDFDIVEETGFVGAIGLSIDPAAGIDEVGRIVHDDTPITRALVIGDTLYTLSELGLVASDLATLDPLGAVRFG